MKWGQETPTIMGRPVVHHPTKTEALGDFSKLSRLVSQIPSKHIKKKLILDTL
jgi:hypothetical protein